MRRPSWSWSWSWTRRIGYAQSPRGSLMFGLQRGGPDGTWMKEAVHVHDHDHDHDHDSDPEPKKVPAGRTVPRWVPKSGRIRHVHVGQALSHHDEACAPAVPACSPRDLAPSDGEKPLSPRRNASVRREAPFSWGRTPRALAGRMPGHGERALSPGEKASVHAQRGPRRGERGPPRGESAPPRRGEAAVRGEAASPR
jgi:hypothetical protein